VNSNGNGNGNGNGKRAQIGLGFLSAALGAVATAGGFLMNYSRADQAQRDEINANGAAIKGIAPRVAVLELDSAAIKATLAEQGKLLDRIETKLDRALERSK
jgi:hypothetical protein